MQMQTRGPGAGWSWLVDGLAVARQRPGKILGATVLLALCLMVPSLLQLLTRPQGHMLLVLLGATAVLSAVFYPLLFGGCLRLLDAIQRDSNASVWQVFDLFRPGRGGLRVVGFGLCLLVVYVAFLALVLTTVGHGVVPWYLEIIARQSSGVPLTALPPLPSGFGPVFALLSVFFLFYSGTLAIGLGQVALRGEAPLAALRDGAAGAFKNVLPLVVLTICGAVALLLVVIVMAILVALLLLLGHFVGTAIGLVLAGLVYVAMLLVMAACMLGINYAVWRDVTGAPRADTEGMVGA